MKILIILLINVSFINATDFFISFSLTSKNGRIISYNFNCAKALSYKVANKKFLFSLPFVKDIKTTCKIYKEEIVDFLIKNEAFIYSNEKFSRVLISRIKLTFIPRRFDIIVRKGRANFYLKE